jgi:hypothetical protein
VISLQKSRTPLISQALHELGAYGGPLPVGARRNAGQLVFPVLCSRDRQAGCRGEACLALVWAHRALASGAGRWSVSELRPPSTAALEAVLIAFIETGSSV